MNDLDHFETQAAETLGAMKELFAEFERRLGQVVSTQRLTASEAREEGAKVRATLEKLARSAQETADNQRQAVHELRAGWQMHVSENSKAAGAQMAKSFGNEIASGLQQRLQELGTNVERATRRFEWMSTLKWGLVGAGAAALGLSLAASIVVKAIVPHADGLSGYQVHQAASRLESCQVDKVEHVCIELEPTPRVVARGPHGENLALVRGM
jgi:hypothetical protein